MGFHQLLPFSFSYGNPRHTVLHYLIHAPPKQLKREPYLPTYLPTYLPIIHPTHPSTHPSIHPSIPSLSMMNDSTSDSVLLKHPVIRFEPQYDALVCLECNNDFPRKPIIKHLRNKHEIKRDTYQPILEPLARGPVAKDWENLRHPADKSAPIEGLKTRVGYVCTVCDHRTTSKNIADDHVKCGGQILPVVLQCWNSSGDRAYWIVIPQESSTTAADGGLVSQAGASHSLILYLYSNDTVGPSLQQIAAIERVLERERQLNEEEESRGIESNGKDDINLWVKWMQWDKTFKGKDRKVREKPTENLVSFG
jgi:hypothetical protein